MDAAEFDAFHAGTYPRLVTSLSAETGDPDRAQRALEDAYARAWSRRRRLGRDVPAETWVRDTAARSAGLDPGTPSGATPGLEEIEAALGVLPHRPLPVAEVRRRGDGRARRRWAGVGLVAASVAAAAAVGLVLVLPGGSGAGPGPPEPLHIQDPHPVPARPGDVSEGFDLALGMSRVGRLGPAINLVPFADWRVCGRSYELGGLTSAVLGVRVEDLGLQSARMLAVARELDLSDADRNAQGIAERYVARFQQCRQDDEGGLSVRTTVARTDVGDEGWTVTRLASDGSREIVQVVRVGSAVLVAGTRAAPGEATTLDTFRRAEGYAIAPVVERMCLWGDDPCHPNAA